VRIGTDSLLSGNIRFFAVLAALFSGFSAALVFSANKKDPMRILFRIGSFSLIIEKNPFSSKIFTW